MVLKWCVELKANRLFGPLYVQSQLLIPQFLPQAPSKKATGILYKKMATKIQQMLNLLTANINS